MLFSDVQSRNRNSISTCTLYATPSLEECLGAGFLLVRTRCPNFLGFATTIELGRRDFDSSCILHWLECQNRLQHRAVDLFRRSS